MLSTLEAVNETRVFSAYDASKSLETEVLSETGTPAGWYPLIISYDVLPILPPELDLPPLPQEVLDYLATHERIHPDAGELTRIKGDVALYEAGSGAKTKDGDLEEMEHQTTRMKSSPAPTFPSPPRPSWRS